MMWYLPLVAYSTYTTYHFVGEASYPYFQSVGLDQLIRNIRKDAPYQVTFELFNPENSFLANLPQTSR